MKDKFIAIFLIFLMLILLFFSDNSLRLIGKWENIEHPNDAIQFTIFGSYCNYKNNPWSICNSGNYSAIGSYLTFFIPDNEYCPPDHCSWTNNFDVKSGILTLYHIGYTKETYKRVLFTTIGFARKLFGIALVFGVVGIYLYIKDKKTRIQEDFSNQNAKKPNNFL